MRCVASGTDVHHRPLSCTENQYTASKSSAAMPPEKLARARRNKKGCYQHVWEAGRRVEGTRVVQLLGRTCGRQCLSTIANYSTCYVGKVDNVLALNVRNCTKLQSSVASILFCQCSSAPTSRRQCLSRIGSYTLVMSENGQRFSSEYPKLLEVEIQCYNYHVLPMHLCPKKRTAMPEHNRQLQN